MVGLLSERYLPVVLALLTLVVALAWRETIVASFLLHHFSIGALYDAIFGWSAIQTGFVFGVYGFVVGAKSGFIESVQGTDPMRRFLSYTRNATIIGFVLTFVSMPLMVGNLDISQSPTVYFVIAVWFSMFIWAFCSFARVAYLFGLLVQPTSKPSIPG